LEAHNLADNAMLMLYSKLP